MQNGRAPPQKILCFLHLLPCGALLTLIGTLNVLPLNHGTLRVFYRGAKLTFSILLSRLLTGEKFRSPFKNCSRAVIGLLFGTCLVELLSIDSFQLKAARAGSCIELLLIVTVELIGRGISSTVIVLLRSV